jgi:hypothetical protein
MRLTKKSRLEQKGAYRAKEAGLEEAEIRGWGMIIYYTVLNTDNNFIYALVRKSKKRRNIA